MRVKSVEGSNVIPLMWWKLGERDTSSEVWNRKGVLLVDFMTGGETARHISVRLLKNCIGLRDGILLLHDYVRLYNTRGTLLSCDLRFLTPPSSISHCTPHLSYWVDRNTLEGLEVARTLKKSAHPSSGRFLQEVFGRWRLTEGFVNINSAERRYFQSVSRGSWSNSYSNEELFDMLIVYVDADCNGHAAQWLY
ncbi:hypothetical protein TNCV_3628231 [Trichonephila clavipes]|nr:hypothetical protein TNCV_3628231 [Trichonephila clavipes]